ncbi:MAG TPA: PP2C family protein-serine/threonine phosphatase [Urbifossiella sp.]|nr:PP2C family protein-serine/threonine phosphatase [Urbifossiella sp.]
MATVLLSIDSHHDDASLRRSLEEAGFAVVDHALGSTPAVEFASIAAAVIAIDDEAAAIAQTRRWRIELGDQLLPILWLIDNRATMARGFEAGADACLERNASSEVLAAQVRSMVRTQAMAERLATKAGESRLLGEQLHKAYAQLDRQWELGRCLQRMMTPTVLPTVGRIRVAIGRAGARDGDIYDVRRLDESHLGFFVADVAGRGPSAALLGVCIHEAVSFPGLTPPEEVLASVNRQLLGLPFEEAPLAAMLVGRVDGRDGSFALARAGLPAPIVVATGGEPHLIEIPGPFLGASDTTYPAYEGQLAAGDKLLIATARIPLDGADRWKTLPGEQLADELAGEDRTVLAIEMLPDSGV